MTGRSCLWTDGCWYSNLLCSLFYHVLYTISYIFFKYPPHSDLELTPSTVTTFRLLVTFLTRGLTNVSQPTEDSMTQNKTFIHETFALLQCYTSYTGKDFRHFETTYTFPCSRIEQLKMGTISCPETSVTNYQSTLCNIPEDRSPHTAAEP